MRAGEAWLNHLYGDQFEARSAGLEPGVIHPLAVKVMQEVGLDLSSHIPHRVFDLVKEGELFSYAITLWDQGRNERPAYFPGFCIRLKWPFSDPAKVACSAEQQLENMRGLRDALKDKIEGWVEQLKAGRPTFLHRQSEKFLRALAK